MSEQQRVLLALIDVLLDISCYFLVVIVCFVDVGRTLFKRLRHFMQVFWYVVGLCFGFLDIFLFQHGVVLWLLRRLGISLPFELVVRHDQGGAILLAILDPSGIIRLFLSQWMLKIWQFLLLLTCAAQLWRVVWGCWDEWISSPCKAQRGHIVHAGADHGL